MVLTMSKRKNPATFYNNPDELRMAITMETMGDNFGEHSELGDTTTATGASAFVNETSFLLQPIPPGSPSVISITPVSLVDGDNKRKFVSRTVNFWPGKVPKGEEARDLASPENDGQLHPELAYGLKLTRKTDPLTRKGVKYAFAKTEGVLTIGGMATFISADRRDFRGTGLVGLEYVSKTALDLLSGGFERGLSSRVLSRLGRINLKAEKDAIGKHNFGLHPEFEKFLLDNPRLSQARECFRVIMEETKHNPLPVNIPNARVAFMTNNL